MALFGNRKRRTEVLERPEYGWIWKPLLVLLAIYLLVSLVLGIWWSQRPEPFDVDQATTQWLGAPADAELPRGARLTASMLTSLDTLLEKPGGWLRNDMLLPGVWLDNMPSWEYGVLTQLRILAKALPAMSPAGADALESASKALQSDSEDWLYPAAEKRYSQAQGALASYLNGMLRGGNGFAATGEGLAGWLDAVSRRFSGLTQQLLASVDDPEALRELGVDDAALPEATPWFRIDNVFFEARGDAWGLLQLLKAARLDYAEVLGKASANTTLERLIAELELAQRRVWSPVILNGSGFGIFANHSLVLANYTQAVAELTGQLAGSVQGVEVTAPKSDSQPAAPTASSNSEAGRASQGGSEAGGKPSEGGQNDTGGDSSDAAPARVQQ
ncbi:MULTISPECIES: DUF2333 family protein [Halomonadaceae]|uniref:DUF2333 family protein n=1 Tax=Modicisalibacter zincidurans TaxID=1178777 RepID=A0ABP9RAU1_9GAMM|nr:MULTISPECIES: DUF2333 family protein [Halomonas]MCD6008130.1 DUF2333 family protein [Halomonas sp. IOP_31]MEA3250230.1 DUF2333 family protein [Pseudomonadota bacterium]